jgi:membrane protein
MNALNRFRPRLKRSLRNAWSILWRALVKYDETDGEQRAASFAYYAFFALFPLLVLLITVSTSFLSLSQEEVARKITDQVREYLPHDAVLNEHLMSTINGVLKTRNRASLIAVGILAWSALRFFQSLVHGVNRAWGTKEYSWWRLPIKNLFMVVVLASALLVGIVLPFVLEQLQRFYWAHSRQIGLDFHFMSSVFLIFRHAVPPLVLFYGLLMFYKFAPQRRTLLREIWAGALFVTIGLHLLQWGFLFYTQNITSFSALYGFFGSAIALLLWIYLSGSLIILGGCVCAARYEINLQLCDQAEPSRAP